MKVTLFALVVGLLMVGCGSLDVDDPETLDKILAEAIDEDKLRVRGKEGEELYYAPNKHTPYTGWSKIIYENGQVEVLSQLKDGKLDGLYTRWYDNGQKSSERNYKDGKKDGRSINWEWNGHKFKEQTYKDGKHWMEILIHHGQTM